MSKRVRCKCPVCGVIVTQERLNEEHQFELIIHEVGSRGRGKIYNIYRKADVKETEDFQLFKAVLARKLQNIAESLFEEARTGLAKGKEAKVSEEGIPAYETGEYEDVVPSSQLSSPITYDEPVIVELEARNYDKSVTVEFEPEIKQGGEREWQGLGEVSPQTVMEG